MEKTNKPKLPKLKALKYNPNIEYNFLLRINERTAIMINSKDFILDHIENPIKTFDFVIIYKEKLSVKTNLKHYENREEVIEDLKKLYEFCKEYKMWKEESLELTKQERGNNG